MRKGLTEVVFILDRSGSMRGLERETIEGFNKVLSKQKNGEGEVIVSTILFNERSKVVHNRVDIGNVRPMTEDTYRVSGCTALLDAVGDAIKHIVNVRKHSRPENIPEKTLFVITTDGMENSSHYYTYSDIKRMIEKQKERYNWEFIFLGANIDAVEVAGHFGIEASRAVDYTYDTIGFELSYDAINDVIEDVRCAKSAEDLGARITKNAGLHAVRMDHKRRGRR